ncbi:MAG: hypothetical protein ABI145_01470 [Steroidobacteraceae bacterium]
MIEAKERCDDSRCIEEDDEPRVMSLLDMRAKADLAEDRQRVARAEWCLEWIAFKRYTTPGRY